MNIPKQPGIYSFYNKISQTIYVGSAANLYFRIVYNHLKNKSSNVYLQNAIFKYGIDNFIINYWSLESLQKARAEEQQWLNWLFNSKIKTYNIAVIAGGGRIRSSYGNHKDLALKGATTQEWRDISEKGGGFKAIKRWCLNVNNPDIIYTYSSGHEAAKLTSCNQETIAYSCNNAKPLNSKKGRWLFSDISAEDLKNKFSKLTQAEINGTNKYKYCFKLLNMATGTLSQEFSTTTGPAKTLEFKFVCRCMINQNLKGTLQSVNNYLVLITKINNIPVLNLKEEFLNRFSNKPLKQKVLNAINTHSF